MIKDNSRVRDQNYWTFVAQYYDVNTGEDNGKVSFILDRNEYANDMKCYLQAIREAFINGDENDGLLKLEVISWES